MRKRRFYLDTEFYEDGRTIDLISLALVREDGQHLYLVSAEADLGRVSPWVRENVLPHLPPKDDHAWSYRSRIAREVTVFTGPDANDGLKPELWAYYADYDWVVLCQLFGTMMQLPSFMRSSAWT